MLRTVLLTLGQLVGALLALLGLNMLAGPAWTALLAGLALAAVCAVVEAFPAPAGARRVRWRRWLRRGGEGG